MSNKVCLRRWRDKVDICAPQASQYLSTKSAEISEDLFFNYLIKIYLSQYRRFEGSEALKNFFEKVVH